MFDFMRCSNCGQENETSDIPCRFCGNPPEATSLLADADDNADANKDPDYAVYTEGTRSGGSKISIIISIVIVLLLLFFAFMIYRRLTTGKKDSSGIFHEESEHEAPLLLPSFKSEPAQAFTIRPSSSSDSTGREITDMTEALQATLSGETTAGGTSAKAGGSTTSFSIRVVVNTDLETETVYSENGDSSETGESSSAKSQDQSSVPSSEFEAETAIHAHIFPDPANHPLIRLYYGADIDKNDDGTPLLEFKPPNLRIFERLKADDQWQEQISLYNKESSNISLVVNFGQTFETGGSIKSSLFDLLDEMELNCDLPNEDNNDEAGDQEVDDESGGNLSGCGDQISLITYGSQVQLQSEMTSYYYSAREAIWNAVPTTGSQLLLHDALYKAIEASAKTDHGTVVIITDGRYRGNNKSLEDALELATNEKVPVYVIYLRDKESDPATDLPDRHSEKTLREFAYKSRGDLFSIDAASDKWQGQLTAALLLALDRDAEDTFLTYTSTFETDPGSQHYVRLQFTFETEDTGEEFIIFVDSLYNVPVPAKED